MPGCIAGRMPLHSRERFLLEGAYEATLWAAVLNAQRTGSPVVFLTQLGGGACAGGRGRPGVH